MSELVFETDRTVVRRWRDTDLADVLRVYGDADAMRWVDDGKPISQSEAERWLEVTETNYRLRGYGMFAVELRGNFNIIGFCGLVHPGGQQDPEIKYAYSRVYWGQGIATEVAEGAIRYGEAVHKMDRIIATTAPENLASHRVLLKAGMQKGELCQNSDGTRTQYFVWGRCGEA